MMPSQQESAAKPEALSSNAGVAVSADLEEAQAEHDQSRLPGGGVGPTPGLSPICTRLG